MPLKTPSLIGLTGLFFVIMAHGPSLVLAATAVFAAVLVAIDWRRSLKDEPPPRTAESPEAVPALPEHVQKFYASVFNVGLFRLPADAVPGALAEEDVVPLCVTMVGMGAIPAEAAVAIEQHRELFSVSRGKLRSRAEAVRDATMRAEFLARHSSELAEAAAP